MHTAHRFLTALLALLLAGGCTQTIAPGGVAPDDDDDAADVYRATIRSIDEAKTKDAIKAVLYEAKKSLPNKDWRELVEHGKLAVAVLEGGDHADPLSK